MAKYIDAEFLKKEIERQADRYRDTFTDGMRDDLISVINSLVDLDADIEMEWNSFNKHLAKYGEESEEVIWLNYNSFKDIAQSFFNRGLLSK